MGWGPKAPAPDPQIGEAAKANADIGRRQMDLAEKQYARQEELFAEYAPMLKTLIDKSIVAQDKATQQSDNAWASYTETWKPVEERLARQSLEYTSPARGEMEAARAAADTASAFDTARGESRRGLEMAGASPTRVASMEAASRLAEAKAVGGVQGAARREVESKGMAYLDNAARFGRNMPSTGIATAQLAGQQGAQAQGQFGGLQDAGAAGGRYASPLFQGAVGANSSAGNLLLGDYQARANAANASNAIFGDVLGAGASLLGMSTNAAGAGLGMFFSSKKLKTVGKRMDGGEAAKAIVASPSMSWSYKPGLGDGSTKARVGPMAEDLAAVAPDVSDGTRVDGISMLGLHHAAIGDNTTRLARIERRLGLS